MYMKAQRCLVLIDGNNFYFKLKSLHLQKTLLFDFGGFTREICGKNSFAKAIYYVGAVKTDGTPETQKMFDNQRRLLAHLRSCGVEYSLGYLLKSNGKFHEKGVDVNIAVDMLVATYENLCDRIVLVSSDTDLLPAVKKAREKGKIVEYVGFSQQPSLALVANCNESHLLKTEELELFVKT